MCRHCNVTKEEIGHQTTPDKAQSRTRAQYDATLDLLADENFDESVCKDVGIRARCPLSVLKHFHPADCLPPDIMHDVLEGVAPSTISLVVDKMIGEGAIGSDAVNKAVSTFPYSPLDTNRPQCVNFEGRARNTKPTLSVSGKAKRSVHRHGGQTQKKHKPNKAGRKQRKKAMRLTASEAWCMLRLLPLILLHAGVSLQVLAGSETFSVVLMLVHIMQVLAMHTVSLTEIHYLQKLIEQFLVKLKSVFPALKLTPKHHYMLHYAEQTKRHGPLRRIWCMRYESKHQVLEGTLSNSRNRKNISRSILRRYQVRALAMKLNKQQKDQCHATFKESLPDGVQKLVGGATLYSKLTSGGTLYHARL